jgi:hypothetical protein
MWEEIFGFLINVAKNSSLALSYTTFSETLLIPSFTLLIFGDTCRANHGEVEVGLIDRIPLYPKLRPCTPKSLQHPE